MVISYSKRFLFVHTPKTGGTSIADALGGFAHDPRQYRVNRLLARMGIHVNYWAPARMRRFRIHASAAQLERHLPQETFHSFFKFAFVRNPWDRMVSYYHYLLSRTWHHRHPKVAALASFKDYLRYEVARGKTAQYAMLTDRSGRLLVDFVGRFEHLHDDFAEICRRLGLSCRLSHTNRSSHRDYREYYDDESIELVREAFRPDVEQFGYTFDGCGIPAIGWKASVPVRKGKPKVLWGARPLPLPNWHCPVPSAGL